MLGRYFAIPISVKANYHNPRNQLVVNLINDEMFEIKKKKEK